MKTAHFLYEDIATHLEEEILNGVLQLGAKLPSIRMFCKQHKVSASTIFQAYYALESKGLIEAKPKSGYYVIYQPKKYLPIRATEVLHATPKIHELSTDAMISHIVDLLSAKGYTRLSTARPDLSVLPIANLQKATKSALTTLGGNILNYDHPTGNVALRQLIAGQQTKLGKAFTAKDIVITSGCTEALTLCLQAVTQKGDVVISDSLTYYGIHQILKNLGGQFFTMVNKDNSQSKATILTDKYQHYSSWFHKHRVDFVILRPDRYIYDTAKLANLPQVIQRLKEDFPFHKQDYL